MNLQKIDRLTEKKKFLVEEIEQELAVLYPIGSNVLFRLSSRQKNYSEGVVFCHSGEYCGNACVVVRMTPSERSPYGFTKHVSYENIMEIV